MFRFFPAAIELRQQPFLWAEDLSTYDSILQLGFEIPFYGSHVSLFTLLMAISTFIYTIKNTQQMSGMGNQFKIISYIMPVMLLFWFNSYASGLSYYYFLANMITFGQNWIIKAFFVDEDKLHRQIKENKAKKGTATKSSFQQRLEDMAKKRGLDPKTGRKK
jgi:YidC/Oxa1 family membrane protein insertase